MRTSKVQRLSQVGLPLSSLDLSAARLRAWETHLAVAAILGAWGKASCPELPQDASKRRLVKLQYLLTLFVSRPDL